MTREEFIGKAADAICRSDGSDPEAIPLWATQEYVVMATAALEAVRAWESHEWISGVSGRGCEHYTSSNCRIAGRIKGAKYMADAWCRPCEAADVI